MIIVVVIFLVTLLADQVTKWWAMDVLQKMPGQTWPVIKDVFHFTYIENRGAAFGMFQGKTVLFSVLTVVMMVGVLVYLMRRRKMVSRWNRVALALLLSGAAGNLVDRIWLGYVRDMLDFRWFWSWVFNIADMCVVIAVVMLIIEMIYMEWKDDKAKKEAKNNAAEEMA